MAEGGSGFTRRTSSCALLDEGQINQLRRSLSAYRGHLTRSYKELEWLFSNSGSLVEVLDKKCTLDGLFMRYNAKAKDLLQILTVSDEHERALQDHMREIETKGLFDEEFSRWFSKSCESATSRPELDPAPREGPRVVPRDSVFVGNQPHPSSCESPCEGYPREGIPRPSLEIPRDAAPQSSRDIPHDTFPDDDSVWLTRSFTGDSRGSSRVSKASQSSKVKLAKARLQVKKVEEELRLLSCLQQFEHERQRLDKEKELFKARFVADQAQIEVDFCSDSERVFESFNQLPKQTPDEAIGKYLQSCERDPGQAHEFSSGFLTKSRELPAVVPNKESRDHKKNEAVIEASDLQRLLSQQQEKTVRYLSSGLERLEMPKREVISFDGDPRKYPRFIKSFEINVERRVNADDERLSYLIQFCSGVAKDAIENCVILPPGQGYSEAKDILQKNFGQKHIIVRAFIERVVMGPQIRASDAEKLSQLARDMRNCVMSSEHMRYKADINSMDTLRKVVMRLPPHIQAKWAEVSSKLIEADIEPEFSHLTDFVEKRAAVANTAFGKLVGTRPNEDKGITQRARRKSDDAPAVKVTTLSTQGSNGTSSIPSPQKALGSKQHANKQAPVTTWLFCNGNHDLERCFKFRDKSYEERRKFVLDKRLCINCLRSNHFVRRCRQFRACLFSGCGKRHHSLLHPPSDRVLEETNQPADRATVDTPEKVNVDRASDEGQCAAIGTGKPRVSLRIFPVRVSGADGGPEVETYAFLDDGSDITLCSNSLAETLGLSGKPMTFSLTTVNEKDRSRSGFEVELNVKVLKSDDSIHLNKVWTVDHLPVSRRSIPTDEDVRGWSHLHGIEFPKLEDQKVEILIGNDNPEAHWVFKQRCGKRKQPYAARTLLGWTLIGPLEHSKSSEVHVNFISGGQEMISSQLKRLYDADFNESLSSVKQAMSIEDQRALAILESSACLRNGHYQLPLPWRFKSPCLPNNRDVAVRRMRFLERRFQKDTPLFEKYRSTVEDYISRGHAKRVPDDQVYIDDKPLWYLPHHPVFHPQKPGKVRVVFDCAARFRDTSLNDQLLQGPDLTNNLAGVLLRFRQEPIALMSDIERMFHQVLVAPDDCHALRFLWWEDGNPSNNLVDHQMLVHLFGAKSLPCCASFALRKTARDNQSEFDVQTVDTVYRNFYVDDCLKSVVSVPDAKRLVHQLSDLLSKGGFHLTKWISNCREVLEFIPASERAPSVMSLDFEDLPIDRALGTQWNVEKDTLSFRVSEKEVADTRRGILSLVSGVYDPLGFTAPLVLPAKMILQELCKQDFGWDDQIPDEKLTEWRGWG